MQKNRDYDELETAIIEAPNGLRVTVLNLGATLQSLEVPTANELLNVVLTYPDVERYLSDDKFIGSTVGPFSNRIRGARFELGGRKFNLDASESSTGHCLHGGSNGLNRRFFDMHVDKEARRIECCTELRDGAGGFPGKRTVSVIYQIVSDDVLEIEFCVSTDRDTVVSLANHAYFNLGGPIEDHELQLSADAYTPVDETNAPTGEIRHVAGSVFDLRTMTRVGRNCFDHNFVLAMSGNELQLAAILRSPESGLQLDMQTTQSGLQLYTGDHLAEPFLPREGLCLEAQGFPDAPNQPSFPSAQLAAGSTYRQRTIYGFSRVMD